MATEEWDRDESCDFRSGVRAEPVCAYGVHSAFIHVGYYRSQERGSPAPRGDRGVSAAGLLIQRPFSVRAPEEL